MPEMINLFFLTLLGSVFGLVGGVMFLYSRRLSRVLEQSAISFAAGVLITVSILGLIPESVGILGSNALIVILISFVLALTFEKVFFALHHHSDGMKKVTGAGVFLVVFGDTIHNFIDGLAIGGAYLLSHNLGFIVAFSTFLHEVPHEVGDFGILFKAKWKKINIVLVNLFSALVTFVGAFLIYIVPVGDKVVGTALAVSAGIFIYLGFIDFLPQVLRQQRLRSYIPMFLGVLVMAVVILLLPHE